MSLYSRLHNTRRGRLRIEKAKERRRRKARVGNLRHVAECSQVKSEVRVEVVLSYELLCRLNVKRVHFSGSLFVDLTSMNI